MVQTNTKVIQDEEWLGGKSDPLGNVQEMKWLIT